jgi:hypothetical protein
MIALPNYQSTEEISVLYKNSKKDSNDFSII